MQLLTLILWFALGTVQQTASGSVEGTVLRHGTTEPLEGVQVTLTGTLSVLPAAWTDKEGHFSFPNVAPGRYTIRVQRDGFFAASAVAGSPALSSVPATLGLGALIAGSTAGVVPSGAAAAATINVGQGEHVKGLAYYLTPGGTISGRILDLMGRPSVGATVAALRLSYQEGRPTVGTVKTATSNDRGEYRIFWIEPGDYLVRAEKTLVSGPARAYYPGTATADTAVKVRLAAGGESPKIDVLLQSVAMVKVSGTVINGIAASAVLPPPAPAPATPAAVQAAVAAAVPQFFLVPADPDVIFDGAQNAQNVLTSAQDRAAGKFEIRNIRPGRYDLIAVITDSASSFDRNYMGHTPIDVGFQDLAGITVTIAPGKDLAGRIVYAGNSPLVANLRVQLRPRGLLLNLPPTRGLSAVAAKDGTFTIPNVPDFEYVVSVTPLPPNAYIADLRQGSFSIFDVGTIVPGKRASDEFEVIVDSPGASIGGKVSASPAQLALGVVVALVPDERRRENPLLYKRTIASEAGVFSLTGVAPGRYTLFAWEDIPPGAEFNAEFMDAFRDDATEITVTPGDTTAVELRLIPR